MDAKFQNSRRFSPVDILAEWGEIFAVFDEHSQDSGNVSYGVQIEERRYFVKTAGAPDATAFLDHPARCELLHNAVRVAESCDHPALPRFHQVLESAHGPMLVYDWVDGELLRVPSARRDDPASSHRRFRALPVPEVVAVLETIFDLHMALARLGWIACDFYDGALIYDFATRRLHVIDLDLYHRGPFVNEMGRMFGSSRFMAPEEFVLGAAIDQRTTVFTLGRCILNFLGDGTDDETRFRGNADLLALARRACAEKPDERYQTVESFGMTGGPCDLYHSTRTRGYIQ